MSMYQFIKLNCLNKQAIPPGLQVGKLSYLNEMSDEFLEQHNFSRDEILSGLQDITAQYGVDGFVEMFLQ